MGARVPPSHLRWYIVIACFLAMVGTLLRGMEPSHAGTDSLSSIEPLSEMPSGENGAGPRPDALIGMSVSGRSFISPTPSPTPTPRIVRWPDWVQTKGPTVLVSPPSPDHPGETPLREGSYLRVLQGGSDRWQVYFGGDLDEDPREGRVNAGDLAAASAPRWVLTTRGTLLRTESGPTAMPVAWLPSHAVMEVLGEAGDQVRVYYLGDGRAWQAAEGWVAVADLAPAGAMLAAESRGLRVISHAEVASLRARNGLWLKVPYRTQLDGSLAADANCGPSSLGMALEFFGSLVHTAQIRDQAHKFQGTSGPDVGFRIEYLRSVVQRYGLKGMDLYAGTDFKKWTLDDLRSHLGQGHPVIPQLKYRLMPGRDRGDYYGDHYVVITGVQGDDFIYNDSVDVDGPGIGRLISGEALKRAWGGSDYPFAAFAVSKP